MREKVSVNEMKKIVEEISASESEKYGIDIKIWPLSFIDIFNPNFDRGTKYTLIKRAYDYINYSLYNGYNNENGSVVVFVDTLDDRRGCSSLKDIMNLLILEAKYDLEQGYNRILRRDSEYLRLLVERKDGYLCMYKGMITKDLFQVIKTCYHEARHSVQKTFDRYSYERFLYDIEMFYMKTDANRDYTENHDEYSFEIGANLYGVEMAREYLKKNYPKTYEREKRIIDAIEDRYKNDYMLYNPSYTIDRVIPRIRMLNPFGDNEIVKHDFIKDTSPVLSIFLNGDGSFKRPSEVLTNEKYQSLDKRIVYAFFSSELFLKELGNIKDLTPEEVLILNNSMDYMKLLCEVQMRYYDNEISAMDEHSNFFERQKMRLIYMRSFFSKYEYVKKYLGSFKENKEIVNGKSK